MVKILITLTALLFTLSARAKPPEYLVGAYYFSGWWPDEPNKYMSRGQDWRHSFGSRTATLGEYNDQPTMNREIKSAADHGIHFFQFLWYFQGNKTKEENQEKLNDGVNLFMASPENARMSFTIEHVNHPAFGIYDEKQWEETCGQWASIFKHPRYLRVGGKAIFKIHGADLFRKQVGDNEKVAKRLELLRTIARQAGAGELLICGGVPAVAVPKKEDVAAYDFLTTYMEVPTLRKREATYPYEQLLALAQDAWQLYSKKSSKPYVPYLPVGWDPRPWNDPRPSFDEPTDNAWLAALLSAKSAMDNRPKLGVPLGNDQFQKMLLIYAWNEFGEGGILAPTLGNGGMPLHMIQKVFP